MRFGEIVNRRRCRGSRQPNIHTAWWLDFLVPFGDGHRSEQGSYCTQIATRWSGANQHRQVSRVVYAVAVDLKNGLDLSDL